MLASESRLMQLNELAKLRDGAYENTRISKERTKKWHDSRLYGDKDFKVGDKVLLYNSHLKMYPGKLKSKWSGPNIVKTVCPHVAIEITDRDGFSFKVNRQRLKKYYGGDIDKEDDEVSIWRTLGNGYGVSTSCKVVGPRERKINEYWWRIYKSGDLKVMAAPLISISLDSSEESVGSFILREILFGTIPIIIPDIPVVPAEVPIAPVDLIVALEVGAVSIISPTGVLDLVDYSSSSDSDPSEDSLLVAPELPLISPFFCSGNRAFYW
ncbi:hypothetical protein Tco_0982427 [Tanacetum coccineum]